tara:strand:+ start:112 stop:609 length:498 start_codon:yes stop_codon:yes gene_type:complete
LRKQEEERIHQIIEERDAQEEPTVLAFKLVEKIETGLHAAVCYVLQEAYGETEKEWWVKGVPLNIRSSCAVKREEGSHMEEAHHYTNIVDLKSIIECKCNRKLFNERFQILQKEKITSKDFLSDLVRFNDIRNRVAHPIRTISNDDVLFLQDYYDAIQLFIRHGI